MSLLKTMPLYSEENQPKYVRGSSWHDQIVQRRLFSKCCQKDQFVTENNVDPSIILDES